MNQTILEGMLLSALMFVLFGLVLWVAFETIEKIEERQAIREHRARLKKYKKIA